MINIIDNVPDHSIQLKKAFDIINTLKTNYERDLKLNDLNLKKRENYKKTINLVLNSLGELSLFLFDFRIALEKIYKEKYIKSPALGKELFLNHYEDTHKPYDKVKEKCWSLLERIASDERK